MAFAPSLCSQFQQVTQSTVFPTGKSQFVPSFHRIYQRHPTFTCTININCFTVRMHMYLSTGHRKRWKCCIYVFLTKLLYCLVLHTGAGVRY